MVGIEAFLKCLIVSVLPCVISGCIYLLNGWTPVSVYDRTALAEIVVSGTVLQTFKEIRTKSETYESKIKIKQVYKGKNMLETATSIDDLSTFMIGNFGDKKMCYSDVSTGESYIFFLTVYKNRLSAKYDDFFGAVVEDTWYTEDEVYKQIGWNEWSEWSSCSKSCNTGQQERKRACSKKESSCDGTNVDTRQCNTFPCSGITDFLEIFGVYKLPLGVTIDSERHTAYNITTIANLYSPLSSVFHLDFPKDFSILFYLKINKGLSGYLLTLSDIMGNQKLAIKYGDQTLFQYSDQNDLPGEKSPLFDIPIADGKWHQLAFSVKRRHITLYFDCDSVFEQNLSRSKHSKLGNNLMFAIGPYFARHGIPFEGNLEQALIIPDPEAAKQQCHNQNKSKDGVFNQEKAIKDQANKDGDDDNKTRRKRKRKDKALKDKTKIKVLPADWSSWSSCTVTCGTGTQSRSRYCRNNEIEVEECLPDHSQVVQNRLCYLDKCKEDCFQSCLNGGSCNTNGSCDCVTGFIGKNCEKAACEKICRNGGKCLSPGVCFCPSGYYGQYCENAICNPPCLNGGQCEKPGICSCPSGFSEPFCTPSCDITCHNGGKCIRHNTCKCKRGYTGNDCSQPVCRKGCQNGGKCVSKNKCSCPQGFRGRRCHKAICRPKCKHGSCILPDTCKCNRGYFGKKCEDFKCKRTCKNGGSCIGPNKCKCQQGYSGKWCHIGRCEQPCMNGGKCRKDKCRCPKGYRGSRCEIRNCKYEKHNMPYQQTYKTLVREEYTTECGTWRWKTCVKTRLRYELVTKTMYRTAYRCV
ncbi:uncharacterized protein LOC143063482 [Mytilus galloprovincialis]|uniref:uncharacterized protein LOC143063482 n=1 Tax=Mytilus galloprovincialis TaxID=29158 RepID=UPI003F7C3195